MVVITGSDVLGVAGDVVGDWSGAWVSEQAAIAKPASGAARRFLSFKGPSQSVRKK